MRGDIAEIAIGLQSAKGVPSATAQHRMRLTGGGFGEIKEISDVEETTGGLLREAAFVARVRAEGAPQFVGRPNFFGLLAYAALGANADSAGPDPFSHTATLSASPGPLPWLTTWAMLASGRYVKVADCKVAHLRLESNSGGLLIVTADIVGALPKFRTQAAYTTDMGAIVVESTNSFLHADAVGALKVEGVAVSSIERAALDIQNSATPQYGDNVTPDDITQALRQITVETTQTIIDFAAWNQLHYGSSSPANDAAPTRNVVELAGSPAGVDFKYTRPGSPERSIEYLVPRLVIAQLAGLDPNTTGDPLKQQATYRALQPAAGSGCTIITKNGQATYPAI